MKQKILLSVIIVSLSHLITNCANEQKYTAAAGGAGAAPTPRSRQQIPTGSRQPSPSARRASQADLAAMQALDKDIEREIAQRDEKGYIFDTPLGKLQGAHVYGLGDERIPFFTQCHLNALLTQAVLSLDFKKAERLLARGANINDEFYIPNDWDTKKSKIIGTPQTPAWDTHFTNMLTTLIIGGYLPLYSKNCLEIIQFLLGHGSRIDPSVIDCILKGNYYQSLEGFDKIKTFFKAYEQLRSVMNKEINLEKIKKAMKQALQAGVPINATALGGDGTVLFSSVEHREPKLVDYFLKMGANQYLTGINKYQKWTSTCLDAIKDNKSLEADIIIKLLMNDPTKQPSWLYVDPQRQERLDRQLRIAISKGDLRLTKILLFQGATINTQDSFGETALQLAVRSKDTDFAHLLLSQGANPNIISQGDVTALQRAVLDENAQLADYLLSYGADPDIANKEGKSALDLTKKSHIPNYFEQFLLSIPNNPSKKIPQQRQELLNQGLLAAVRAHFPELVTKYLRAGANVNYVHGSFKDTPLMAATRSGSWPVLSILVDHGADIRQKNNEGKTAIDIARKAGSEKMANIAAYLSEKVAEQANAAGILP